MEIFDIVDEKGIPTGETIERTQAHEKGVRHRTAHIWIVREQDGKAQLLLQKRSAEKDSFPGRFDTSSAGHIQAGDEPEESAIRETALQPPRDQRFCVPMEGFQIAKQWWESRR